METIIEFISNNIIFVVIGVLVLIILIVIIARPKKKKVVEQVATPRNENEPHFLNPDKPLVEPTPEPEKEPEPEPLTPEEEAKATWAIQDDSVKQEEEIEVTEKTFSGTFDDFNELPKSEN